MKREFKQRNGKLITIDLRYIATIEPLEDGCTLVRMRRESFYIITTSYDELKMLVNDPAHKSA
jgi:hypothetical protein